MIAFYEADLATFASASQDQIVGQLSAKLIASFSGDHSRQLAAWRRELEVLVAAAQAALRENPSAGRWGVLIEYPLLRLQRRLDVVLLCGKRVLVVEFKVGASTYQPTDIQQAEDYSFDLRYFHEGSHHLTITPVLCSTEAPDRDFSITSDIGVGPVCLCNARTLCLLFRQLAAPYDVSREQLDHRAWEAAAYRPLPTIIEAAELLYAGHEVGEIAHSGADAENLGATTDRLIEIIAGAQKQNKYVVVFVTGVPGSGKTLVGLNAIHDPRFRIDGRGSGAFLSGNSPLVTVLREALARDDNRRTGKSLGTARTEVKSEIQGLMTYLDEYLKRQPDIAPAEHVIVFDEAQRAWDAGFGAQKFDRARSEPELFLEIMERHPDWAVIVALVGGGQEINRGERGLSEWGVALEHRRAAANGKPWTAASARDAVGGGDATAWQSLFEESKARDWVAFDDRLHLSVSVRSHRCVQTAQWINALLAGKIEQAHIVAASAEDFPVFLTRSLSDARQWLLENARGTRRVGLVASSGARRLRADGLGVSLSATELGDVANWYLLPKGDIRSSFALEVTANEYTCQGLELDYVGVCWGGDFLWDGSQHKWFARKLNGPKWHAVRQQDAQAWTINKYRVLLSRARLGSVIWVPEGDNTDETRDPRVLDEVAQALTASGLREL